jgi:uncharacterized damage-inducible protein DinB
MATAVEIVQRLHQHRLWVNENLLAAASPLSEEHLRRSFPIGQGSIWSSLVHLYAAEFVWLEALLGNDDPLVRGDLPRKIPGNQLGDGGFRSMSEFCDEWTNLAERWKSYLATLTEQALNETVYKVSFSTGERFGTRRSDVLLHVCTHGQYTSAQVINMLRHVGTEKLPDTMLISLARQEATKAAT